MLATVILPAAAFAQTSGDEGYSGANVVAGIQEENGGGGGDNAPVAQQSDTGSTLPFTGSDFGVIVAAGGLLIGLGFGLRRLTTRPSQA